MFTFRQRTFHQHVGIFPIGGGVGGGRNLGAGVAGVGGAGGGGDGVASKDVVSGLDAAGEPGVAIGGGEGRVVGVGLVDGEGGAGGVGVQERGDSGSPCLPPPTAAVPPCRIASLPCACVYLEEERLEVMFPWAVVVATVWLLAVAQESSAGS
jgi:hypothetical protein